MTARTLPTGSVEVITPDGTRYVVTKIGTRQEQVLRQTAKINRWGCHVVSDIRSGPLRDSILAAARNAPPHP